MFSIYLKRKSYVHSQLFGKAHSAAAEEQTASAMHSFQLGAGYTWLAPDTFY